MSAETGPNGTQPLPVVEGDPAATNLDPALAELPVDPAVAEAPIVPPNPEDIPARPDGYVQQSREAYQDAKEQGKQFMQDVGRAAVSKVVRRKRGSAEATGDAESNPDDAEATRASWRGRAAAAKGRVATRLEDARTKRVAEHTRRKEDRRDRRQERKDDRVEQKRQEDVDRRADRLDDQIHKATMTRKEFNEYKFQKQARKDKERDDKMWADWRAQREAKQRDKRVKQYVREHAQQQKAAAKAEKAGRKAADRAQGKAFKMNERYDERQAKAAQLTAERDMIAALRDDPEAYANFLKKQAQEKHERRHARVVRAQKIGSKIVSGANLATKVAVGAAVSGAETAAIHGMYAAEELSKDEKVQYAKLRAEIGWVAVRRSLGEVLAKAGERVLPTTQELETVAQTGELPLTESGEVSVEIDHDEGAAAEQKQPAGV